MAQPGSASPDARVCLNPSLETNVRLLSMVVCIARLLLRWLSMTTWITFCGGPDK